MPRVNCCVPLCSAESKGNPDLHFYRLPKKGTRERQNWVRLIRNDNLRTESQWTSVCSLHFQNGRKTYDDAVPTIFPWSQGWENVIHQYNSNSDPTRPKVRLLKVVQPQSFRKRQKTDEDGSTAREKRSRKRLFDIQANTNTLNVEETAHTVNVDESTIADENHSSLETVGQLNAQTGKNDLQTEADRSAQRCIMASLHKQFPKIPIYGEEELAPTVSIPDDFIEDGFDQDVLQHKCPDKLRNIQDDDIVIWVDPLDGTKEFTEGYLDHVTVLIGIAVNGVATAGVINQPFHNFEANPKYGIPRAIWGIVGLGSFGFVRNENLEGNIITTSRSHSDYTVTKTVNACDPSFVLRVGGAGHKVLLLIEKKAHAYVFPSIGCKKWDTCAPEAILRSLGGCLTDIHGQPVPYHANVVHKNMGGVLATVDQHQWYVDKIRTEVDPETLAKFETQKPAPPRLETTLSQQKFDLNPNTDSTDSNADPSSGLKAASNDSQQLEKVEESLDERRSSRKRRHEEQGDSKL